MGQAKSLSIPVSSRLVWLAVAAMSGCTTTPAPLGAAVSADAVGDRAGVVFGEVVETSSGSGEAEWILRRMETRVAARLSEVLGGLGWQTLADTPALRQQVLKESQAVVDEALRQWKYGADYKIEMVVASLYWTDASVGRPQRESRW